MKPQIRSDAYPDSARRLVTARLLEAAAGELRRAEFHDEGGFWLTASKAETVAADLLLVAVEVARYDGPGGECLNALTGWLSDQIVGWTKTAADCVEVYQWHAAEEAQLVRDALVDACAGLDVRRPIEEVTR